MIKYKCTCPINKDCCYIYNDQRCCIGCRHTEDGYNSCRCSQTKCKCKYKIKWETND